MLIPLPLIALIAVLVLAVGAAGHALVRDRERQALLNRAGGQLASGPSLVKPAEDGLGTRFANWLMARAPESMRSAEGSKNILLHAGFESATAQVVFNVVRIASAIAVPLLALMIVPRRS